MLMSANTTTIQNILSAEFLGKKITVPVPERDNNGRTIPNKTDLRTGVCEYIGAMPIMKWELAVVIDGMPVEVKHITHIKHLVLPARIRSSN